MMERMDAPGGRHVSLWHEGSDLFGRRAEVMRAIDQRLAVDPHATLDVVLRPREPFPLNLVDALKVRLAAAPATYLSRSLGHRGENAHRRIAVVLPLDASFPRDWIAAVRREVPVFREQPLARALEDAASLGEEQPGALILDPQAPEAALSSLASLADPDAVAFADRALERAWQARAL